MTINIMLHCRDGIVMACDTLGSMIEEMFKIGSGSPIIDPTTGQQMLHPVTRNPIIDINTMQRKTVVRNSFGFENKIFQLKDYPVAVLINGIASIGNRPVEDLVDEFCLNQPKFEDTAGNFNLQSLLEQLEAFLLNKYSEAFPSLPNQLTGPNLNLQIGGFSSGLLHGEIWELSYPSNSLRRKNTADMPYTMICGGQADAVQRFIDGIEPNTLQQMIAGLHNAVSSMFKTVATSSANHVLSHLRNQGLTVPDLREIPPPPPAELKVNFPFNIARYDIPFNVMSLQDAVDFVTFLGYITFGRQKFVTGIPTVGGSLKVAVITRKTGYRLLTDEKIQLRQFQL